MSTLLTTTSSVHSPTSRHDPHSHHDDASPVLSGWAGPSWSVPVQMAINALDWGTISIPVVRSVLTAEISLMAGRGRHHETRETVATLAGVCYGTVGRVRSLAATHGVLCIDDRGRNGQHTRPKRIRLGPIITNATNTQPPSTPTDTEPDTPTNPPAAAVPASTNDTASVDVDVPNADLTPAVAPTSATAVAPTSATSNTKDNYLARGASCQTSGCNNPIHLNQHGEPNRLCKPCYWHQRTHPTHTNAATSTIRTVAPCFDPPEPIEIAETEYRDLLDALDGPGISLDDLQALNRARTRPARAQGRTPQWAQIRRRLDRSA